MSRHFRSVPVADQSRFCTIRERISNQREFRVLSTRSKHNFADFSIEQFLRWSLLRRSGIQRSLALRSMPLTEPIETPLTKNSTELSDFMDAATCVTRQERSNQEYRRTDCRR